MNIDGVIFDLDGTLLDSMPAWENIGSEYLQNRGIIPNKDLNERLHEMSLRQAAEFLKLEYSLTDNTEAIENDINHMMGSYYYNCAQPKAGVPEFLAKLYKRGVRMCVVTETKADLAEAALRRCGLLSYFLKIFSGASDGLGKNSPNIFEKALSLLNTPKETTWVFEDSFYAVRTAKSAGFNVVGIYDKSQIDTAAVRKFSDIYIRSFTEMENTVNI
jgi:HAD superfamily hydrolase (TIGR01509 family)